MTFAEMLRGSPLNQQRMADDNAMNLAGMLARGRAGTVRQEPSLMQGIGGAITDYAVPDRYSDAINPSVMSPKLGSLTGVKDDGSPYSMADAPDPVPMLMDTMPMAGITAWHGSPHKFSKFDMSKIGTGEGAQAYGHGLYFAENPKVAKEYADELTREIKVGENIIQGKDKTIGTTGIEDVDDYLIADRGDARLALSNMKKDRLEIANSRYPENAKSYDAGIEMLEGLVERGGVQNTTAGNFYKVDIPDDQIAKMLDWDKPLSEQSSVMDFIEKNFPKANKPFEKRYRTPDNRMFDPSDSTAFEFLQSFGSGNRAKASEMLKDQGIPGIKYLDQGSRGAKGGELIDTFQKDGKWHTKVRGYDHTNMVAGEPQMVINTSKPFSTKEEALSWADKKINTGTSNFVLFSDEIAKILERNDQPIGDLAEELLGK